MERWPSGERSVLRLVVVGAATLMNDESPQLVDSCVIELRIEHRHMRNATPRPATADRLTAPCLVPGVDPSDNDPWLNTREPVICGESNCVRCNAGLPSPGFRPAEVRDGLWRYRAECSSCGDWIPQAWQMLRCSQCGQLLAVTELRTEVDCGCGANVIVSPPLIRPQREQSQMEDSNHVFQFDCPHCRKQCLGEPDVAGRTSVCPHCFLPVEIPLGGERTQEARGNWITNEWHCGSCGQAIPKSVESCPFCDVPNRKNT